MSITNEERTNPTEEQLHDLLELLSEANRAGQLVSITYMLRHGDAALVDYRGSNELTELATRTVRERIAEEEAAHNPAIAAAIRAELAKAGAH